MTIPRDIFLLIFKARWNITCSLPVWSNYFILETGRRPWVQKTWLEKPKIGIFIRNLLLLFGPLDAEDTRTNNTAVLYLKRSKLRSNYLISTQLWRLAGMCRRTMISKFHNSPWYCSIAIETESSERFFCPPGMYYHRHLYAKKGRKLAKSGILPDFDCFWPRGGQMLSHLIFLRPDLESFIKAHL